MHPGREISPGIGVNPVSGSRLELRLYETRYGDFLELAYGLFQGGCRLLSAVNYRRTGLSGKKRRNKEDEQKQKLRDPVSVHFHGFRISILNHSA